MLKQIRIDQLRLGMHLHALCGRWVDHPFWKTRFVLCDPADLAALRASGLSDCWIDVAKGLDLADAAAEGGVALPAAAGPPSSAATAATAGAAAVAPAVAPAKVRARTAEPPKVAMRDELARSVALVDASKEAVVAVFQEARLGAAIDGSRCLPLVADITASVGRHRDALISLTRLKSQDDYTYLHSVAVCALMVALAQGLGMEEAAVRDAGLAGLLHDIGKALIPSEILSKPGKLTAAEYACIQTHPLRGHELLAQNPSASPGVLDVCLHHHERPDGEGYPHRLKGDDLSVLARMGAICDVYDALTSDRAYKKRWDPAETIAQMADWTRGGQFDPVIFGVFLKSLGVYPTGSLVRLQSGKLAVVVEQTPGELRKPKLKCFYSTRSNMPIPVEQVDTADARWTDPIVGRESNEHWKFTQIDELWAGRDLVNRRTRVPA